MSQAQVSERATRTGAGTLDVQFAGGDSYEVSVRGHRVLIDQPAEAGGQDAAPTPTELFVASLAGCVAFYAGRYLTRHGYDRNGLAVQASFEMASDRPARVSGIQVTVQPPSSLPANRRPALLAVVSHCTVHNTLRQTPSVAIGLTE